MVKYLSFIMLFLLCNITALAEEVQKFEGEVSVGFTVPLADYYDGDKILGPDFGLELRYNIPRTRWDCGLALDVSTAVYQYDAGCDQSNRSINLMAVGDYNLKQGSKFNPYAGMGMGVSFYDAVNVVTYKDSGTAFVFRPRVGIEMFRHLRIEAFFTVTKTGYSNFGLSIGGVIGGRPKKK
ncbi:MAG: acyloxyacyl hydrolase [Muribaculaceae bacterium]|nr:acyloxyacyl hydrolase [Muribaculaceae bacterium]